ncbi:MAG: rRNA maturation RNase YbeY [bacterium]
MQDNILFSKIPSKVPKIDKGLFALMKKKVLGEEYDLSIAFVGKKEIKNLNDQFRKIDLPTDILSFPLDKNSGEIIFCFDEVKRKSELFGKTPIQYLNYLFIHGLLHLKGMEHSSKMEAKEKLLCKIFAI